MNAKAAAAALMATLATAAVARCQSDPAAAVREEIYGGDAPLAKEVKSADYFRVEPRGAQAADVDLVRDLLCEVVVRLRAEFGAAAVERLLTGIDCTVHVFGAPTAEVSEGMADVQTSAADGRYRADVRVLAPSAHRADFRSAAGEGPGADYSSKTLAHEYATLLLDRLTQGKPKGWRFFTAPPWFVQGYEEYAAIVLSRPHNRDAVLPAYVRRQKDERVRFGSSIEVADPYVDGAVLLHFLHERYGRERVQALLAAPQPTFAEALTATLGSSIAELGDQWRAWRGEAVQRTAWLDAVRAATTDADIAAAVVDQDLKRLPAGIRDKVVDALRRLAGKDEYWRKYGDGSPHRLLRVNQGSTRWALVVTYEGLEVPGVSWMAVHLFDAKWKQAAIANYPTGYRISLFDVWSEKVEALADPVLVVRLGTIGSFGNFTYRERQYYALHEDRVALVRIEEEGKEIARGQFSASHPWTGPRPPQRTAQQWVETLADRDPATVLETLAWLGGHHLASDERREANFNNESVEDSRLWETVRDDPRTRERLTKLLQSPLRWVRESAAAAADPGRQRR